mmetsp:Transcript_52202/g.93646  ORF Transcript_52202/g.93646 Transcript_52202/m.93646 type:complete len:221 (+) Transcript_52202:430-1092(+)
MHSQQPRCCHLSSVLPSAESVEGHVVANSVVVPGKTNGVVGQNRRLEPSTSSTAHVWRRLSFSSEFHVQQMLNPGLKAYIHRIWPSLQERPQPNGKEKVSCRQRKTTRNRYGLHILFLHLWIYTQHFAKSIDACPGDIRSNVFWSHVLCCVEAKTRNATSLQLFHVSCVHSHDLFRTALQLRPFSTAPTFHSVRPIPAFSLEGFPRPLKVVPVEGRPKIL